MKFLVLLIFILSFYSCGESSDSSRSAVFRHYDSGERPYFDSSKALLSAKYYDHKVRKFFSKKDVLPPTDSKYLDVIFRKIENRFTLNNIKHSNGLKEVLIKGKKIVFSQSSGQGVLDQINNMTDIAKVTLEAEEISVLEDINLPNSNLYISARKITFYNNAQINTTPLGFHEKASLLADGENGINAGEIVLNTNTIEYSKERVRPLFVLNGGRGQDGSDGIIGKGGSRLRDLGEGVVLKVISKENCDVVDRPRFERRYNKNLVCSHSKRVEGTNAWPTNGGDATAGSRPGTGGSGGYIESSTHIPLELIELSGGESGASAGEVKGGDAGVPNTSFHQNIYIDRKNKTHIRSTVKRISKVGKPAVSPEAKSVAGERGIFHISKSSKNWQSEGYLEKELEYATDLYIANHIEEAKLYYSRVGDGLNKYYSENETLKSMSYKARLNQNLLKINTQKDYFGNSINWVPSYSLEVSFSKFKNDLESSLKTLYLTYWIRNSQKSLESKVEAIESLQELLIDKIKKAKINYQSLVIKIPLLKDEINKFTIQEEFFSKEVKRVETEIERMANANIIERHKVPFLKKALNSIAAISTVIPAGQPALGSIGSSLGIISQQIGTKRNLGEIINDSASIYKMYSNLNLVESRSNWNSAWSKIDLSKFKEINSSDDLRSYVSELTSFSAPIIQNIKKQVDRWKEKEVSQSEISIEIDKIKKTHPLFLSLVENLQDFMMKKATLVKKVHAIETEISQSLSIIYSNFDQVSEMSYQKKDLLDGSDKNIVKTLDALELNIKARMLKYHYEVARAYEYRLLKPYLRSIDLNTVMQKMRMIIESDQRGNLSEENFKTLESIYTEELSTIVSQILEELKNEGLPLQREKVIQLSSAEVRSLNEGKVIHLDLISESVFPKEMEDIRINNILIEDLKAEKSGNLGQIAELSLEIAYSGASYIRKGGEYYYFEKDTNSRKTKWGTTLDLISGESSEIRVSPRSESLISTLIGTGSMEDLMLLARPGGLTQLRVELKTSSFPRGILELKDARIRIIFDYNTF